MDIDGSLARNLRAAIESARRHDGHPVHPDTIAFWSDLLHHARTLKAEGNTAALALDPLLAELDATLAKRRARWIGNS